MTSYVTPKKNAAYIFYVGLVSSANRPDFQTNPTLAAGDVKVSIDGGALNNLATLPDVQPDGATVPVRVQLSADEMNGDNIVVVFIDQTATSEWDDLFIGIQTSARQVEDLAYSAETMDSTVTQTRRGCSPSHSGIGKGNQSGVSSGYDRDAADSK